MFLTHAILVRRHIFTLFLFSTVLLSSRDAFAGDAMSAIVGPVTAYGTSPWPWYDLAAKGNADEVIQAALQYPPLLGPAAAGTFTLADTCPVTLTGPGTSEFSPGDLAIAAWNVPGQPPGTGHRFFQALAIAGDVMTDLTACGMGGLVTPGAGLTVYHCGAQCSAGVTGPNGQDLYDCTLWAVCNANNNPWGFYDPGLALYRMYLRTGNTQYLTTFRNYADTWWTWALDQGGRILNPPRGMSLASQFVRALDGHPERLPPLYAEIKLSFEFNLLTEVDGNDNREPGYMLLFAAIGARADTDPVRQADYCSIVTTHVNEWLSTQRPEGYWAEKNGQAPYMLPGVAPWRMFSVTQGLARSYDVLNDPGVCNNPSLAARTLVSLKSAASFSYNYGYASNSSRGVYYEVEYPNAGQTPVAGPGTVSVSLSSATVTGTNTTFLTTFAPCNGTTYIGIQHSDNFTWTHRVQSCTDDTHLTLGTPWGTQCLPGYAASLCATTAAVSEPYLETAAASSNCASFAAHCWDGVSTSPTLDGDRNNNRDPIWIMGWLYHTTQLPIYKTWGDELFSASYGGPALGPGDGFPGAAGPCGGPACDGTLTDYMEALHSCASNPALPCNPRTDYPGGNVWVFGSKRWAQGSGIGGADNYLAWRAETPALIAQTIAFGAPASVELKSGGITLTASATSGLPVTFTSGTASICAVSGASVAFLKTGICSITATQAGNAVYSAATPVTQSFAVTQSQQTIVFVVPRLVSLRVQSINANATATSGLPVALSSNTPDICGVSGIAIELLKTGTCSVTAAQAGNAYYAPAASVTRVFAVTPVNQTTAHAAAH
jgi:hypothetical protein